MSVLRRNCHDCGSWSLCISLLPDGQRRGGSKLEDNVPVSLSRTHLSSQLDTAASRLWLTDFKCSISISSILVKLKIA